MPNRLRCRRAQPGDKWHVAAVFLTIKGTRHSLWRAIDQDDNVLDILVQSRRNKQAAKKFFRIRGQLRQDEIRAQQCPIGAAYPRAAWPGTKEGGQAARPTVRAVPGVVVTGPTVV